MHMQAMYWGITIYVLGFISMLTLNLSILASRNKFRLFTNTELNVVTTLAVLSALIWPAEIICVAIGWLVYKCCPSIFSTDTLERPKL